MRVLNGLRHVVLCALAPTICWAVQAPAHPWSLTVVNHSGQGPILGSATLDDSGRLTAAPALHGAREVHRQVGAAELAAIEQAILELNLAEPPRPAPPRPGCCDIGYSTQVITVEGRPYALPPTGRLSTLMWTLQRDTLRAAEDRYWLDAPPFDPGRAWTVTLKDCWDNRRPNEDVLPGRWPIEDKPNSFAGSFRGRNSKQPVHDSVIVESVTRDRIVLTRAGRHEHYVGQWDPEQPDEFWFRGGYGQAPNSQRGLDNCSFTVRISR
jgi:hypothetical protein